MPISVVDPPNKIYKIAGAEFKLKNPTLRIKQRLLFSAHTLNFKIQEFEAVGKKLAKAEKVKTPDDSVYRTLSETAEKLEKVSEEVFIKAEEFLRLVLEPINPEDISKLTADDISEEMIVEVLKDFFQYAGLLPPPVNK